MATFSATIGKFGLLFSPLSGHTNPLWQNNFIAMVAQEKLKNEENIFLSGCNQPKNAECIGRDFALLSSCNHTIITHGSLGLWAAFLAGGEIYTEYGAIIPESYV